METTLLGKNMKINADPSWGSNTLFSIDKVFLSSNKAELTPGYLYIYNSWSANNLAIIVEYTDPDTSEVVDEIIEADYYTTNPGMYSFMLNIWSETLASETKPLGIRITSSLLTKAGGCIHLNKSYPSDAKVYLRQGLGIPNWALRLKW